MINNSPQYDFKLITEYVHFNLIAMRHSIVNHTSGCFLISEFMLMSVVQGLSQDLETGCPKLAVIKFWGVQFFKGDNNILRFQP